MGVGGDGGGNGEIGRWDGGGGHNTRNFNNKSPDHVSGSAGGGETRGSEGGWLNE